MTERIDYKGIGEWNRHEIYAKETSDLIKDDLEKIRELVRKDASIWNMSDEELIIMKTTMRTIDHIGTYLISTEKKQNKILSMLNGIETQLDEISLKLEGGKINE